MSPIRLTHANPDLARITVVDWTLHNRCNYACSYCPPGLHEGSSPTFGLDVLERFAGRVIDHYAALGQSLFFQFTGGEPTLHPRFCDLLAILQARSQGGTSVRAGVISNGSMPLDWWERARPLLHQAVLTHHVEFVRLEHFLAVVQLLGRSIRTHVNVTMHPDRFEECLAAARTIAERCVDITLTLKPLLVDFGGSLYAYTPQQREILATTHLEIPRTRPLDEVRGAMRREDDHGATAVRRAAEMILAGENRFAGWRCLAGVELLSVSAKGQVFRALCRQGGLIGHIGDAGLRLPGEPVVCAQATCHCATDLMTTRWREIGGPKE